MRALARIGSATTSMPSMNARPASGRMSVVKTRTAVVLPAPFGPSRPTTLARSTVRSTPSSALVSPKDLCSPSANTAASEGRAEVMAIKIPSDDRGARIRRCVRTY
jgi:hypothetical protein